MRRLLYFPFLTLFLGAFLLVPDSLFANTLQNSFARNTLTEIQFELLGSIQEKMQTKDLSEFSSLLNSLMMPVPCSGASGEIGGKVFGDFNYDGFDNEISRIPDIVVNIYDCDVNGDNQLLQTTTSDVNGEYTFTGLTDGTRYRIEFIVPSHLPAYQEAFLGDNLGAIQYAVSPSCGANVGFTHPQDYCETNPALVATCFINGDPLANGAEAASEDVLVGFNWDDSGTTPLPDHIATAGELGSCYGLGYDRENKKLYTSAFIKRHVGLGPLGIGGIYEIDMTDPNNPIIKQFLDVESIGVDVGDIGSNSDRGLPLLLDDPSNDSTAYSKIGREGIGALSVSEDGKIWFVNLFDKKLYSVIINSDNDPNTAPTAGDVESFSLPNSNCNGGEFRPFAVEVFRDEVFVGGVCDGSSSQLRADLSTIIYQKSGTSFTELANYSLDFDKGWASNADTCENYSGWFAWTDNLPPICATGFYIQPQPIVSEFEFDIDGSLMVGYMDRTGHQLGYKNYPTSGTTPIMTNVSGGDLLRVDNNNGTYVLENNGSAGNLTTSGAGNTQGPGGGEFYFEDIFAGPSDNIPGPPHAETSQGGLAFYRGSGDIMTTALDPYSTLFNSGGVNFLNTNAGTVQNPGYVLYRSSTSSISTFAKANGLGGLTILCANDPPIQIGKYIWQDDDSDGIQDACELGLAGINVTLFDENGNSVQTTSTDANGYYAFTDLNPNTQYYIVAGTGGQFSTNTFQLNGSLYVTMNDIGDGSDTDKTDSDAQIAGSQGNGAFQNMPFISVVTGGYGYVTNSADFGFTGVNLNPIAGIGGFVWNDQNQNGIQNGGENGIQGVTVTLFDSGNNSQGSTTTDVNGDYFFPNVSAGDYYLHVDASTNTAGVTNYLTSPQNQGGDDTLDSDIDPNNGQTSTFSFDPVNGNSNDNDAGFFLNEGTISGYVWNDENGDGIQNNGETGFEGVTIIIIDNNSQLPIDTVLSDVNGNYSLTGIPPGDYILDYNADTNTNGIPNLQGSPQDQGGDDTLDSDIDPNTNQTGVISFNPTNGDLDNVDAGFFESEGTIGGFVWDDTNENGIQENGEIGLEGITVHLIDSNSGQTLQSVVSNSNGAYAFSNVGIGNYVLEFDQSTNAQGISNLQNSPQNQGGDDTVDSDPDPNTGQTVVINYDPTNGNLSDIDAGFYEPSGGISGFVWHDLNEDGLQNNGENGIEGVTIILQDAGNDLAIDMVLSDASGNYTFSNIGAGDYYLTFYVITNVNGITDYQLTQMNVGNDDSIDSDAHPNTGETDPFTFDPINGISSISAGYFIPTEMVGGFVWLDSDMDGIQDNNEVGIQDVTIILYDENDNQINSTLSGVDGSYGFENVPSGNYYFDFDFSTTVNPFYEFTLQDQGNNDAIDSDADPATGETVIFNFIPLTGSDNTWSAGLILPYGSIGDFVFHDCNGNGIQDMGESGVGDVKVCLIQNGISVDSMNTFGSGYYLFTNVPAGTYSIRFGLPTDFPDYYFVPKDVGGDDAFDSDADPTTGETDPFEVFGGEEFFDIDAGFTSDNEFPVFINPPQNESLPCSDPQVGAPPTVTVIDNDDPDLDIVFDEQIFNGNGGACQGGLTIIRTWAATDDCGHTTVHTQTITSNDELPPVIVGIPDITVECDSLPGIGDVKAIDDCDQDIELTYSDSLVVDEECMQLVFRKWVATDDCGNMSMNIQKITLIDSGHPKITLTHPLLEDLQWGGSLTMECESATEFVLEDAFAMDACDDDPMLMLMISNQTGDCETDGYFEKITYVWLAEDNCGNTSTVAIVVYLTDETAPIATNIPADITVDCQNIPGIIDPIFDDNCDDDLTLTFDESIQGDTCSDYQIFRTWTALDDCDNLTTIQQVISVEIDDLMLLNVPDDITVECTEVPDTALVTAQNDCAEVILEFSEVTIEGGCEDKIIRTWVATDDCGNEVTAVQTITTEDTTPPEITFSHPMLMNIMEGDTLVFECDSLINFNDDDAIVIDECDDDITPLFMEMPEVGDCEDDGFIVRLECCWKAEDDCGNQAEFCIFVEIVDETPPTLSGVPDDLTIDLSIGEFPPGVPFVTAEDNCDLNLNVLFMENQVPGPGDCGFILTRTWIAEDICGNQIAENQIITAIDNCECDNILVNNFTVSHADCDESNGGITLDLSGNYSLELAPDIGTMTVDGFDDLPFGMYELTVTDPDFMDCEEKIFFDVFQIDCRDTMCTTITEPIEICIDSALLNYSGVISSANILQNGNPQTVMAISMDNECIELMPAPNYLGTSPDLICVELCYNGSQNQCDTTYLKVIVEEPPFMCDLDLIAQIKNPNCEDENGEIIIDVTGNVGNLSYQWNPNISQSNVATNLSSGNYEIIISDDSTGCVIDTSLVLIAPVQVSLDSSDILVTQPICPSELGTISSNTSIEYQVWQGANSIGNTPLTNLSGGIYSVVYSNGICSDTLEIEIFEVPDWITSYTSTGESCDGNDGSITLMVDGANGNYTYNWWPNVSSSNAANGLNANTEYSITVTDGNGCEYFFTDLIIENTCDSTPCQLDLFVENIQNDQCNLGVGSIEIGAIGAQGNISYSWIPMVSLTNKAMGLPHGTYEIMAIDSAGCMDSIVVVLDSLPPAWKVGLLWTDATCAGNDGTIDIILDNAPGGLTFDWVPNVSDSTSAQNLPPGDYEITVTDSLGCSKYVVATVGSANKTWTASTEVSDATCGQTNGSIVVGIAGTANGLTYTWSPNVSTNNEAQNLGQGNYAITVTDEDGCSEILNVEIGNSNQNWTINPQKTDAVCGLENGTITLEYFGDSSLIFSWFPDVSSSNFANNLAPGNYEISVTDTLGCSEIINLEIINIDKDWSINPNATDADCGQNNGSIILEVTGNPSLTYSWTPGVSSTDEATNLIPGFYQVVVQDSLGCSENFAFQINGFSKSWSVNETHSNESCAGGDGSIKLQITDDPGNLSYTWIPNVSSTNEAQNLSAGIYEIIIEDQNGCTDSLSIEIETIGDPNWSFMMDAINESCVGNDGSITLQITGGTGILTYQWLPNVSDSSSAFGLTADSLYSVIATDENGCVFEINDLSIANDCDPIITTETINENIICGDSTAILCGSLEELPGAFSALLIIQQPTNGGISLQNDTCLLYEADPNFEGLDIVSFVICDDLNFCDTTHFEISVDTCTNVVPCLDFISEENGIYVTTDCNLDAEICLDYPLDSMLDLTIYDNGDFYFDDVVGCMNDTTLTYSYFAIPGGGSSGPYELVSWTVNGSTHSASFNSIQELGDWMNSWDGTATWVIDSLTSSIIGGNPQSSYSALSIEQTNSGATANLELNVKLSPNASQIYLPVGFHEVVFVNGNTGCSDTLLVEVVCIMTETIVDTVVFNEMETTCVDLNELPGTLAFNEILCTDCDNANFNIVNNCLTYTGVAVGEDLAGVVVCDDMGFCDTTWFQIFVVNGQPMPLARIDADTVQTSIPSVLSILSNDEVNGEMLYHDLNVMPTFGQAILNIDGTVTYTSNQDYCGLDAFAYEICNEIGCDTATVNLLVKCPTPIPMTGFSPNNDGVNDGFKISGIEQYPENELLIFNRWGEKVYEKKNYLNGEWQGTYDNLDLPDGTYFYLLKYGTNGKMTGWLQIER